jgi:hypothetical protein
MFAPEACSDLLRGDEFRRIGRSWSSRRSQRWTTAAAPNGRLNNMILAVSSTAVCANGGRHRARSKMTFLLTW